MNSLKIIPVKYANSVLPESMVFENGTDKITYPIVFMVYLLKLKNKLILVDAGCETMPEFVMTDFVGTVNALKTLGVSALDITDIIITHSHHDHIECVKYFENTNVFINKNEYPAAKPYLNPNQKVIQFENEITVTPEIKVVTVGGHSEGSCVVEINCNNKIYVIAGDECYLSDCLKKQIITGCSYNKQKSREFIKKYSNGNYTVLFCHDPEIFGGTL